MPRVVVEFYGLARSRAGRTGLAVEADTVRAALEAVGAACPGLRPLRDGRVAPEFLLSLGGTRFTDDPDEVLPPVTTLLILGAESGG